MIQCGVGKSGCSHRVHIPEIAGSNPVPATRMVLLRDIDDSSDVASKLYFDGKASVVANGSELMACGFHFEEDDE